MKYLLICLAFIIITNSYGKEFSISSNIGYSFPLGNFKDNSNIYSNCNKDAYGKNPNIKIENTSMNNNFYYDFGISYIITRDFKLNAIINKISNKFAGINVTSSKVDVNTHQWISNSTSPEFISTNLYFGIDYYIVRFDEFSFFCGIEPNISFINYNIFDYYLSVPTPYIVEDKISKTSFGIGGKIGAEYSINNDFSITLSCKYSMIFSDYNHGAESLAYLCIPLNDYYTTPKYFISSLGISYKIF